VGSQLGFNKPGERRLQNRQSPGLANPKNNLWFGRPNRGGRAIVQQKENTAICAVFPFSHQRAPGGGGGALAMTTFTSACWLVRARGNNPPPGQVFANRLAPRAPRLCCRQQYIKKKRLCAHEHGPQGAPGVSTHPLLGVVGELRLRWAGRRRANRRFTRIEPGRACPRKSIRASATGGGWRIARCALCVLRLYTKSVLTYINFTTLVISAKEKHGQRPLHSPSGPQKKHPWDEEPDSSDEKNVS